MAIKSRINIDVESSEFQAFQEKFNKYADSLKAIPGTWNEIGKSTAVAKTNFESIADSVKTVGTGLAAITTSGKEFYHVTTATARHWHDLALSTGQVAGNIVRATESLIKWTGILSLVTGGAGLFGFDRMAVANQRSAALGVGSSYGSRAAFLTNFRRLGDPEGVLGRVSEAQSDPSKSVALRVLGLSDADMRGDPADVAIKALRAGAKYARNSPEGLLGQDPHLQLFSLDERRRLRLHPEEVEEMAGGFQKDRNSLALDPKTQLAYTNFTTQMEKAARTLETTFVKGLLPLEHPLERLSKTTTEIVEKFMKPDGPLDHLLTDLGKGLDWLDSEIKRPEFVKNIEWFMSGVGSLVTSLGSVASKLASFASWLGIDTASASTNPSGPTGAGGGLTGLRAAAGLSDAPSAHSGAGAPSGAPGAGWNGGGIQGRASAAPGSLGPKGASSLGANAGDGGAPSGGLRDRGLALMNRLVSEGWSPEGAALVAGNTEVESGIRTNPPGSNDHGTSRGMAQWHKDRKAALEQYLGDHPGESEFNNQVDFFNHDPRFARYKHIDSLNNAGEMSKRAEGYSTNTTGLRASKFQQWLSTYKNQKITVSHEPGGNHTDHINAAAAGSP
ncbi:MAG TPA: phage tail tip lysozyme [Methylobacter sp.]|jgi:hypothetical protein